MKTPPRSAAPPAQAMTAEEPQTAHALWHTLRLTRNDAEGIPFIEQRDRLLIAEARKPLEDALREVLAHDFAEECQECGIGHSEVWAKAKAALALATPGGME